MMIIMHCIKYIYSSLRFGTVWLGTKEKSIKMYSFDVRYQYYMVAYQIVAQLHVYLLVD